MEMLHLFDGKFDLSGDWMNLEMNCWSKCKRMDCFQVLQLNQKLSVYERVGHGQLDQKFSSISIENENKLRITFKISLFLISPRKH